MEPAPTRRVYGAGRLAWHPQLLPLPRGLGVGHRYGGEQGLGVRVERLLEHLLGGAVLHYLAQIHDCYVVAHVPDYAQVMAYEQVGEPELLLQVLEEVEDLGLHRDVEGRGGLVQHYELRVEGQDPRYRYPLPLAAAELVGVSVEVGLVEPHLVEQVEHELLWILYLQLMHFCRLHYYVEHGHPGVQATVGVLEHHLSLTPELFEFFAFELKHVPALEVHFSRSGLEES